MRKSPTRRGPRAYHHHDLPRALTAATLALIAEEGMGAVSLRRVAHAVGVSPAAPYRHYRSRSALLAAIATEGFVLLADALREATAAHADTPDRILSAQGVAYVRFAVERPAHFRVMQAAELGDRTAHPALQEATDAAFLLLRAAVETEQRAGRFPPGDPDFLALGPWSVAHGLAMLALDGQLARRTLPTNDPVALAAALMAVGPART